MWPWSKFRAYEDALRAERESYSALRDKCAAAERAESALLAVRELLERRNSRLEDDLDSLRSDHRRLIDKMTALAANRGSGGLNVDRDPFAENDKLPDQWVQPESADPEEIAELMTRTVDGEQA